MKTAAFRQATAMRPDMHFSALICGLPARGLQRTAMTRDQFVHQLAMMLRDLPRGTAADLNECMAAYWNGSEIVFAFLCERGTGAI